MILRISSKYFLLVDKNGFKATFLGFSVYVSNSTNKDDGQICFHDNGYFDLSTIPAVLTLNCSLQGRYITYFNNRTENKTEYSQYAETNLCEFEVYGNSITFKCTKTIVFSYSTYILCIYQENVLHKLHTFKMSPRIKHMLFKGKT